MTTTQQAGRGRGVRTNGLGIRCATHLNLNRSLADIWKPRRRAPVVSRPAKPIQRVDEKPVYPVPQDLVIPQHVSKRILAEVCAAHSVTVSALRGPGRAPRLVIPRQLAMWRMRSETKMSLAQIGNALDRHHTTVIAGLRSYAKRLAAKEAKGR